MCKRKNELKKWFIDHPIVTVSAIAEASGRSVSNACTYLYQRTAVPQDFLDVCRKAGIPDDLLPEATRTKAELLAEVEALRAENAQLRKRSPTCDAA